MEQQPSMLRSAMNYGAIIGLALIAISLVSFLIGNYESKIMQYVSYAAMIGGLYWAIKCYRDKENGGFIAYSKALGFGVLTALFFGIITAFFTYIYIKFVDDTLVQFALEQSRLQLEERGMGDDEIEAAMQMSKSFTSPGFIASMALIGNVFIGFIISLVIGLIVKKEDTSFN